MQEDIEFLTDEILKLLIKAQRQQEGSDNNGSIAIGASTVLSVIQEAGSPKYSTFVLVSSTLCLEQYQDSNTG